VNVHRIRGVNRHPAECADDSSPESTSDTENWLKWNGDLDNPNESEDDWEADNESHMALDNGSNDSETLEQRNVSAAPNVPRLFRPIRQTKKKIEKPLMTVSLKETRKNKGIKKK
jgi:hypothetical protein